MELVHGGEPGGGQVLGLIFPGYVSLASQSPYPIIVDSVANYRPHLSHLGKYVIFAIPNLVTFYFYELSHFLDWMKKTLLFINTTNILVHLLTVNMKTCLTPKNRKMCDPILGTLLKMQPHYSQSGHENANPIQRHISIILASYKSLPIYFFCRVPLRYVATYI